MVNFSIIIIVGLSFSLLLLVKRLSKAKFTYMSELASMVVIGIITLELFYGWLINTTNYYKVPFLLRINTPFVFLIGPSIYFLVRSKIYPSLKWDKTSPLHLFPFLLVIVYFLPLYVSPQAEKLEYLEAMYHHLPFDSVLIGGLRRIHQAAYLLASIILLSKTNRIEITKRNTRSIYAVLVAFGVFLIFDIYRYFFKFDLLTGMIDTLLLSSIAIYLVYQQLQNPAPVKYIRKVDRKLQAVNAEVIDRAITQNKPYLNPKFNLAELAALCKLQKHIVSQTINQEMHSNFNELINKYRVDEAIRLLKSTETKNLTIQAIAETAGFNSVSSFNANFKKITEKSPKEYRA